ncbi:MAG: rhomboid family intramembrane serine protease [Defluviitaleaceae bacterium]|nr:rhomboid family intramembrane serine protease [Defluviitaleaceae bacterium]
MRTYDDFMVNFGNALGAEYQPIPLPAGAPPITIWARLAGGLAFFYILYNADKIGLAAVAKNFAVGGISQIAEKNSLRHSVCIHIFAGDEITPEIGNLIDSTQDYMMAEHYDAHFGVRLTDGTISASSRQPADLDSAAAKIAMALGRPISNAAARRVGIATPIAARPYLCYAFMIVNILIFAIMEIYGSSNDIATLVRFGAIERGLVMTHGQYWRLLTPIFVHIGIMHLLFNLGSLLIFGTRAERYFGHVKFLIIYIITGVAGNIAMIATADQTVGAGASGSIFGAIGAILAFILVRRQNIENLNATTMAILILVTFFAGFAAGTAAGMPAIAHWAHFGGLTTGFGLGALLAGRPREKIR